MSNNLTRKGLAVSSGLAIALTSLVGVAPATAAAGDVTISPTAGDTYSVFNSDLFGFSVNVNDTDLIEEDFTSDVTPEYNWSSYGFTDFEGASDPELASDVVAEVYGDVELGIQLTNEDAQEFGIILPWIEETQDVSATDDRYLTVDVYNAGGDIINTTSLLVVSAGNGSEESEVERYHEIDFDDLSTPEEDAVRVHIYGFDFGPDADVIGVILRGSDETARFPFVVTPLDGTSSVVGYGDGDFLLGVRSWLEVGLVPNYETVDSNYASPSQTIEFLDPENVDLYPRIERFVGATFDAKDLDEDISYDEDDLAYEDSYLNVNEDWIGFSVAFPSGLNLEQTNLGNWSYDVSINGVVGDNDEGFDGTGTLASDAVVPASGDDNRVFVEADAYSEDAGDRIKVDVYFDDMVETGEDHTSPTYIVPSSSVDFGTDITDIFVLPTSGMVHSQGADDDIQGQDSEFELPTTQKTTTYNLQLIDGEDAASFANVPVAVIVAQYGDLDEDSTITVSNANYVIDSVLGGVVASGVTDASGKWTFTVTHSSATAGEGYFMAPVMIDEDGYRNAGTNYGVTYAAAAPSEITPSSSLLAGTSVSVTFTVTDQFGRAVSKAGTRDLFVGLTSSDGEDLDLSAAVSATGEATFTFTNYLATAGTSDTLLAQVYTGTATNPSSAGLPSVTVDLYNAKAADSVSAPTSLNAVVTYGDFITGKASATNVAPASADGVALTATVRDAAGLGIPGAIATVSGAGFQFKDAAGNYAKDSISVVANSNGQFTVTVWTHEANANGKAVTVTSGGKTASTLIKSYLPTGLNGDVLDFKFTTIPTEISKNTTYSVTAKLTDKWGNPVATQGLSSYAVVFESSGSVQLNSTWDPIVRNFGRDGSVTVFLRAAADVAGDGEITARITGGTYEAWNGSAVATSTLTDLGLNSVNNPATAWDETKWTPELVNTVKVLNVAPVTGKVNVGSFNGKLVVYAAGLNGKTISWKVGGVWGKAVANSDYVRFDRPTPRRGVDVKVEIYVDKQLLLTKTVRTR